MTMTEPKIVQREQQPFAAIMLELTQPEIAEKAPHRIDDVLAWLREKGVAPTGAPFFNYVAFAPGGRMTMHVGLPVSEPVEGDGTVIGGVLPGGRYVSLTHTGPYHELMEANMAVDTWARQQGLQFAGEDNPEGFRGATRLEIYHTDPGEHPSGDPVTEVAFRLAD